MNVKEQHLLALERANEIRTRRAVLKRAIRGGEMKVTSILGDPIPDWLRSEPIGRFLKAIPKMGDQRVAHLLATVPIGYWRTVGNLTPREKAVLTMRLRELRKFDA